MNNGMQKEKSKEEVSCKEVNKNLIFRYLFDAGWSYQKDRAFKEHVKNCEKCKELFKNQVLDFLTNRTTDDQLAQKKTSFLGGLPTVQSIQPKQPTTKGPITEEPTKEEIAKQEETKEKKEETVPKEGEKEEKVEEKPTEEKKEERKETKDKTEEDKKEEEKKDVEPGAEAEQEREEKEVKKKRGIVIPKKTVILISVMVLILSTVGTFLYKSMKISKPKEKGKKPQKVLVKQKETKKKPEEKKETKQVKKEEKTEKEKQKKEEKKEEKKIQEVKLVKKPQKVERKKEERRVKAELKKKKVEEVQKIAERDEKVLITVNTYSLQKVWSFYGVGQDIKVEDIIRLSPRGSKQLFLSPRGADVISEVLVDKIEKESGKFDLDSREKAQLKGARYWLSIKMRAEQSDVDPVLVFTILSLEKKFKLRNPETEIARCVERVRRKAVSGKDPGEIYNAIFTGNYEIEQPEDLYDFYPEYEAAERTTQVLDFFLSGL